MTSFSVHLAGVFHTFELYDAAGREIMDMVAAADYAESEFGADWDEVFSGSEGIDRDEYIERYAHVD